MVVALEKTYQKYVAVYEASGVRIDKLQICTNLMFYKICCMSILMNANLFRKPLTFLTTHLSRNGNPVFNRCSVATDQEQSGQSLDDYPQELRTLSYDCNFRAVTKTVHCDCFILQVR